jgi:hypothetical protein
LSTKEILVSAQILVVIILTLLSPIVIQNSNHTASRLTTHTELLKPQLPEGLKDAKHTPPRL